MGKIRMVRGLGLALAILLFATPAQANLLIPVIAVSWFGMVVLFVPIVLAEALILWLQLDLPFLRSLWVAGIANLGSTVLGIPAAIYFHWTVTADAPRDTRTWFERVHWAVIIAPWEISEVEQPEDTNRGWMPVVAITSILLVFFAGSWVSEAIVAQYILDEFQPARVWTAIGTVNVATYSAIGAFVVYSHVTTRNQNMHREPLPDIDGDEDWEIVDEVAEDREPGIEDKPGEAAPQKAGKLPSPDHRDAA